MYKVGDKLLCKKDYWHEGRIIFDNNKYYTIMEYDPNNEIYDLYLRDNEKDDVGFYITTKINMIDIRIYYDYFYTKQEERKLKLERLCLK